MLKFNKNFYQKKLKSLFFNNAFASLEFRIASNALNKYFLFY